MDSEAASAISGPKKEGIKQNAQCPFNAAGYGKASKALENDGTDHWAVRDHKWRVNTGKNQRLFSRTHHRTHFREVAGV